MPVHHGIPLHPYSINFKPTGPEVQKRFILVMFPIPCALCVALQVSHAPREAYRKIAVFPFRFLAFSKSASASPMVRALPMHVLTQIGTPPFLTQSAHFSNARG